MTYMTERLEELRKLIEEADRTPSNDAEIAALRNALDAAVSIINQLADPSDAGWSI
jgi:hypothetical protein